jgi:hypothetical protein
VTTATAVAALPPEDEAPWRAFGDELGVLFQIVDDILDATGTAEELGKTPGKDEAAGKVTYVSLHGLEHARELADEARARVNDAWRPAGGHVRLQELVDAIRDRRSSCANAHRPSPQERSSWTARARLALRPDRPRLGRAVAPREEVYLAADQHDTPGPVGALAGATRHGSAVRVRCAPALAPARAWSGAAGSCCRSHATQRCSSLHGTLLLTLPPDGDEASSAPWPTARVSGEPACSTLRSDPRYGPYTTLEAEENRELITWDGLLAVVHASPAKGAAGHSSARATATRAVTVSPWPFREDEVTLVCDGRLLTETYFDEPEPARPREGSVDHDRDDAHAEMTLSIEELAGAALPGPHS